MPKPTTEQLQKINRFSLRPLTEDEVYVFQSMMIDDRPTAYYSKIHVNLLRKFVRDANRGVGLLMNHNSRSLPVGRSFEAYIREEFDSEYNEVVQSLYGMFYIDLGRQTESGMSTDDIVKGIEAGTIFDTSIGFSARSWKCTICGNDIRDWQNCSHFPGEKYQVKGEDGVYREEVCYVSVGEDGDGELLENSLVFAGASDRATIRSNFSVNGVSRDNSGTKLHLVESFKNIPLTATIYQYYTKDGSVFFTDTSERTDGDIQLKKRSESEVEFSKLQEMLAKYGIKVDTQEEFSAKLESYLDEKLSEVTKLSSELKQVQEELAKVSADLEAVREQLGVKDATIDELTRKNEELSEKAELANTYRQDLIEQALKAGVRAQGNAFKAELFEKFLATLSVDEIKEVIRGFEEEFSAKFEGVRIASSNVSERKQEELSRDDFETEEEFRAFVAQKAVEYAKANNISISEATKFMYKKYSKRGGSEE